jgi:FKBP-type peptidyl-prolyl cis-trans isomerase
MGALRPVIIRLGGEPVPGVCKGLNRGITGMRVGGRRTFTVPSVLGFGSGMVLGPYGKLLFYHPPFHAGKCLHEA